MASNPTPALARMVDLCGPFDLASARAAVSHEAHMTTEYVHYASDGQRVGREVFWLTLRCPSVPGAQTPLVCSELAVTTEDGPRIALPGLENWRYTFDPSMTGADGRGPLWGIDQEPFQHLLDANGTRLPFKLRYAAYITFIDFHSLNDVFTRPMPFGQGIQDLHQIGDRVVHPASHIEAPVSFGPEIGPESRFSNGEITLELKGLGMVDGANCAIVSYDAGESRLKMILDAPERGVARGASFYKGDLWIDLASRWVTKATLDEYQIAETETAGSGRKGVEYTVRHLGIRSKPDTQP